MTMYETQFYMVLDSGTVWQISNSAYFCMEGAELVMYMEKVLPDTTWTKT